MNVCVVQVIRSLDNQNWLRLERQFYTKVLSYWRDIDTHANNQLKTQTYYAHMTLKNLKKVFNSRKKTYAHVAYLFVLHSLAKKCVKIFNA